MVWPFGRKKAKDKAPASPTPHAPSEADEKILAEVMDWLDEHAAAIERARVEGVAQIRLGPPPTGEPKAPDDAPAGAVLKAKKGKLSWVDLYDPALRPTVDALIKHLDKQQKWYFNGVVSTKYEE